MGLREKRALKTREAIYDAMLTLAERDGYEAATLEQVADRAEVAVSTVYRYFRNKDAILLGPIESNGAALVDSFRTRPLSEDVTVSLGWTVHDALNLGPEYMSRLRRLRSQLDLAPGPRSRLWDLLQQQRSLLEDAIAERSGQHPLWNAAAAHLTLMIITMAFDHNRETFDDTKPADYAGQIMAMLRGNASPLPRRE